jgi:hypothetical protein
MSTLRIKHDNHLDDDLFDLVHLQPADLVSAVAAASEIEHEVVHLVLVESHSDARPSSASATEKERRSREKG